MKKFTTILCFCMVALASTGQELRWEFVNAVGFMHGDSASLRWTMGESFTTEVTGTVASLRMGFMPFAYVEDQVSGTSHLNTDIEILVSPNPATKFINVKVQDLALYDLRLFAQNGAEILSTHFQGSLRHDISSYANGAYTLIVIDPSGAFNTTTFVKI